MTRREALQAIYNEHGQLTPELVREVARDKGHPLHPDIFDKKPSEAAEVYYLERAHEVIRSVKIVYGQAPERSVRAWHALRLEEGYTYEPAEKVATDPFLRKLLLADMEREWHQLRTRYEEFDEFWKLVNQEAA